MISVAEARESARLVFREYLTNRPHVPDDIAARMSIGCRRDGADWIVVVALHSGDPKAGKTGLEADLHGPRPQLVATIRVAGQSGHATLEEWVLPIWQAESTGDGRMPEQ
jgi:hypothetical protein